MRYNLTPAVANLLKVNTHRPRLGDIDYEPALIVCCKLIMGIEISFQGASVAQCLHR